VKQVTQRLRDGRVEVVDVPRPVLTADGVLVEVRASLLSAGTERSTAQAARSGIVGKARARPDQARQVLEKARRDGVAATVEAVRTRLERPTALGYSSAGTVLEAGERVRGLRPGDRVACAGGGHAVHAELNQVPSNLCVRLPEEVSFEAGAFATVGSIALHAVRQAEAQIGERVAVIGLGLVGALATRILRAAGCEVVGIDLVDELVERARPHVSSAYLRSELDPQDPPLGVRDCDAIILTAATGSDDPVRLAGALARDRGRVVVVGDVGLTIPRPPYYGKELELRLSRSYGPGRYDRDYEERGLDYPIGYVRWTERRNLAAFVALLADRRIAVDDLITARIPVQEAPAAYERLVNGPTSPLGLVLTYEPSPPAEERPAAPAARERPRPGSPTVGVIGAGSFAQRVLIPGLRAAGFELAMVASANGLSAHAARERFGFDGAVMPAELLGAEDLDAVCVASRHSTHAQYAIESLRRGRAVFVEKPPALSEPELEELRRQSSRGVLWVGFNRRFAPLANAMREHVVADGDHPVELLYRIAAGRLPGDHWLSDPDDGGGRLLGEGCHFVDFACWFAGALPTGICAAVPEGAQPLSAAQSFSITLTFPDGSIATIVYGSESARDVDKEYVEAHSAGRTATLHDYRRLELRGAGRRRAMRDRARDKGHRAQLVAFRAALDGEELGGPDPLDTMEVTLRALRIAGGCAS
jgi:predicted dehydrogenase/NADPH:quinone reductase-like Zn-dependent oxidoreductase